MRTILLFCLLCLPIRAADITITVTVPDAKLAELQAAVDAWRANQKNADGTPKYPTRAAALRALVAGTLRHFIINVQPTTTVQTEKDKLDAANAAIKAEAEAIQ